MSVGRLASTPSKRSSSGAHSESCSGAICSGSRLDAGFPRGPGSARICGSRLMRSSSEPPLARRCDLGFEDVDARLGEAAHVGDLGLELHALGVLGAQVLDACSRRGRRGTRGRARVRCDRVRRPCLPRGPFAHGVPPVALTVPSGPRRRPCVALVSSAQHPAALSVGYGSVVLPLSPPMRTSKWRCGARGVAGHAGEPDHLALGDGAALADELREVGVEVGVAVGAGEVRGVAAGTLVRARSAPCRPSPRPPRCRWARTCRCRDGRRRRRSRRCRPRRSPGTGTGPSPGWAMIWPGAARRDRSAAARRAPPSRPRAPPCAARRRAGRCAISASRRAWRSATACSTSCWFAAQGRELGVELVADLRLLALLTLELGLLVLQLRVDRGELLHDVVVGLVGLVEQLLAAGGVDRVGGVDERLERRARVRVGVHRPLRGVLPQLLRLGPWSSRSSPASLAMCSRVSSSWWSAVENAAAVSLAAARASVSFWRAAARSSLVAAPAAGAGASASATGQRAREHERGEQGGEVATEEGHAAGIERPEIRGTLAAGRRRAAYRRSARIARSDR